MHCETFVLSKVAVTLTVPIIALLKHINKVAFFFI